MHNFFNIACNRIITTVYNTKVNISNRLSLGVSLEFWFKKYFIFGGFFRKISDKIPQNWRYFYKKNPSFYKSQWRKLIFDTLFFSQLVKKPSLATNTIIISVIYQYIVAGFRFTMIFSRVDACIASATSFTNGLLSPYWSWAEALDASLPKGKYNDSSAASTVVELPRWDLYFFTHASALIISK